MTMYNKIFTRILDSSVWLEPTPTRIVWITMIAAMDENGFCQFAAVGNVAGRARVTEEEARNALDALQGPDPESSDQDNDGRRIERVPGGWMVLNAPKYRSLVTRVNVQERTKERVRRFREKKRSGNAGVTHRKRVVNADVTPSESESESESLKKHSIAHSGVLRVGMSEAKAFVKDASAEVIYALYPKKVGKQAAIKAINKALKVRTCPELLLSVQNFMRRIARDGTDPQFIPHPATWFNQGRYDDEEFKPDYEVKQGGSNGNYRGPQGKGRSALEAAQQAIQNMADREARGDSDGAAGDGGRGDVAVLRGDVIDFRSPGPAGSNQLFLPPGTRTRGNGVS